MTNPNTAEFRNYLEWSDEGKPTFWRYMGVLAIVLFIWRFAQSFLPMFFPPPYENPLMGMVMLVVPFLGAFISLPLVTKYILKRPAFSSALPSCPPRWGDWFLGAGFGLVIMGVTTAVLLPISTVTYRGWDLWTNVPVVAPFLLVSIVGLFLQTGFEEMYFRGLFEQLTRKYTKNIWLILGLPAIGFSYRHIGNISDFGSKWTAMLPYLLLALSFAWTAWRTGSLLMPMGLHFTNNLSIALFVSTRGDVIPTISPFVNTDSSLQGALAYTFVQAVLTVAVVEAIVRRRERQAVPAPTIA